CLFCRDERAVGGERLSVLHTHGGGTLGGAELEAGCHSGRLSDLPVGGVDRLLLVLGEAIPILRRARRRGGALVNEQHELHRSSLVKVGRSLDARGTGKWTTSGEGLRATSYSQRATAR